MIRALLTNDWHFASKNPVSRTDDYNAELFTLLDQLHQLVVHFKPQVLCVGGDIFHDKGRAPWPVVIRLLEWAQRIKQTCPIVCIPGNHDLTHDRYASRAETPIGALIGSGHFLDVSFHNYPDGLALGVYGPVVFGIPWPDGAQPLPTIPDHVDLVMIHGFVSHDGAEKYGTFSHRYEDLAAAAPWVKVWHFGHDHTDSGVYTCANGAKVVSVGALCRGALDTDTLTRQVKVALATIDGQRVTVQQIALKTRPVDQIFNLALRAEKAKEAAAMADFVEKLQTGLASVAAPDFHAALQGLPLEAAVRVKVEDYIKRAEQIV